MSGLLGFGTRAGLINNLHGTRLQASLAGFGHIPHPGSNLQSVEVGVYDTVAMKIDFFPLNAPQKTVAFFRKQLFDDGSSFLIRMFVNLVALLFDEFPQNLAEGL